MQIRLFYSWQLFGCHKMAHLPIGYAVMAITTLCVLHLTGLLIARFILQKSKPTRIILSTLGWALLNCLLFVLTV